MVLSMMLMRFSSAEGVSLPSLSGSPVVSVGGITGRHVAVVARRRSRNAGDRSLNAVKVLIADILIGEWLIGRLLQCRCWSVAFAACKLGRIFFFILLRAATLVVSDW